MLIKFAVSNFRGFSDKITWDLSHPNRYDFNDHVIKNGSIKNGIIYGPNGSGKSNFGLAIFDIINHLTQKWKKQDYYRNFVYAGNIMKPVTFEYHFKFSEKHVVYEYSKDRMGILLSERLTVDNSVKFDYNNQSIFVCDEFPIEDSIKNKIATSTNSISLANYIHSTFPLDENHYLVELVHFADSMLWFSSVEGNQYIGLQNTTETIDEFIIREGLVKQFAEFLYNISEQKFDFLDSKPNDNMLVCNVNGVSIPFNYMESTGTKSLTLLFYWMCKIGQASFVFIDEFDAFYHFRLSMEVCKRLFQKETQIFLSSHNTYLMTNDLLRPDCNFILSNNKIKPLCDCTEKELRFGHNIEKIYRANAFQVD